MKNHIITYSQPTIFVLWLAVFISFNGVMQKCDKSGRKEVKTGEGFGREKKTERVKSKAGS